MKGVIVQTGHPKSIVLFNNGKIRAIPTPANCHVGMVVTVKINNLLKIIFITLAALLLIALGIFIGARYFGGAIETSHHEFRSGSRRPRHMMDSEDWPGGHGRRRMQEQ
jgi:hypothetical protein